MCNYNHGPYLAEAVQSFLDQTRQADEIVVVDDGSTDNSLEVLRPMAEAGKIRLIVCEKNLGIVGAFARGLEEVRGQYLLGLAADDKSLPNFFEHVLSLLEKHPQAPFGVGCIQEWFPDRLEMPTYQNVTLKVMPQPTYVSPETTVRLERAYVPLGLMGYGAIFRTELMRQIWPDLSHTGYLTDWFLMRTLAFRSGYCFLPEVVVHRRNLPGSLSNSASRKWSLRQQACLEVLRLLDTPTYADVKEKFRDSGALVVVGYRVVLLLLMRPRYWEYLNLPLLRKSLVNLATNLLPESWRSRLRAVQMAWLRRTA